jgi:hypothetical protein
MFAASGCWRSSPQSGVAFWFVSSPSDILRLWIWTAAYNELSFFGNGVGSFASQLYSNGISRRFTRSTFTMTRYSLSMNTVSRQRCPFSFLLLCYRERKNANGLWFWLSSVMGFYSFPLFMAVTSFMGLLVAGRLVRSWAMDGIFRDYCGPVACARHGDQAVQLFPWSVRIRGVVNGWR